MLGRFKNDCLAFVVALTAAVVIAPSLAQAKDGTLVVRNRTGAAIQVKFNDNDWITVQDGKNESKDGRDLKVCVASADNEIIGYAHIEHEAEIPLNAPEQMYWKSVQDKKGDAFLVERDSNKSSLMKKELRITSNPDSKGGDTSTITCS